MNPEDYIGKCIVVDILGSTTSICGIPYKIQEDKMFLNACFIVNIIQRNINTPKDDVSFIYISDLKIYHIYIPKDEVKKRIINMLFTFEIK